MASDLRLKLLELTNRKGTATLDELTQTSQLGVDVTLTELKEKGLVTCTDGVLSIESPQRILLAEQLIHAGLDPRQVSRHLGWQEFEEFAEHTLGDNGFATRKHFVFKSEVGRREIDVLAWNDTFTLALDCKHWLRGLSTNRLKETAAAQAERVTALSRRPELLYRLKMPHPERRFIIPVILALGDVRDCIVQGVPVVSISKLLTFVYGLSPIDDKIERVPVREFRLKQLRLA